MITAGDFRNGVTFEMDGQVMQVVEFQHVKPGKGAAFVRTKMKNVITGAVTETSFNPTAKFEQAFVERKEAEYSARITEKADGLAAKTYQNILVVKEGNENTAKTKELKKALKSDEVRDYINKNYKGAVVPVF